MDLVRQGFLWEVDSGNQHFPGISDICCRSFEREQLSPSNLGVHQHGTDQFQMNRKCRGTGPLAKNNENGDHKHNYTQINSISAFNWTNNINLRFI